MPFMAFYVSDMNFLNIAIVFRNDTNGIRDVGQ